MLSPERRDLLVSHLREVGSARTADLVDLLGVSDVTVRRDVDRLVREGRARRFHGGVSLAAEADREARSPIPSGLHLGVLVPASSYFRAVMAGVSEVAARLGVRLSLALSWYQPDQDLAAVRRLLKDGVDGLLLAPPPDADGCALMDAELRSLPVPVVLLERRLKSDVLIDGLDHVVSDHATGAGLAVQHLAAMGHRRVALVVKDSGPTARAVQAGHSRAVSALGLADDLPVLSVPQFNEQVHGIDQRYEEAVTSLRQARASAVLVHSDTEAVMLQQLAQRRGLRIPRIWRWSRTTTMTPPCPAFR